MRTRQNLIAEFTRLGDQPSQADVRAIAKAVTDAYIAGEVDRVMLVYPKYVSTVTQTPTVLQLLPVQPPAMQETAGGAPQYIFEPDAGDDLRGAAAALRRDADLSAAAGDRRQLLLGADGGDAQRDRQRQ